MESRAPGSVPSFIRTSETRTSLSERCAFLVKIWSSRGEWPASSKSTVGQIPRVDVVFDNLRVNGKPVRSPQAVAVYPKGVPDYARAIEADGGVLVEVGKPVPGRQKRRVDLTSS